jgi:hypothetical protein
MINVLRKNQKALWIVIALLCIPFIFYFSNTPTGPLEQNFGTLYGRPITELEARRSSRMLNLARDLGMFTYLQAMIGNAQSQDQAYTDFMWNRLVLRHEAKRLGIKPSSTEIANMVKTLRPFRGEKGFELAKYNEFAQLALPAMGFTEAHVEEIVEDQLILDRMKQVVTSGVQMPEAESKENYDRAYGKVSVAVARVRMEDIEKQVQISDDDIAKFYEAQQAQLNTDEKRKVSFVTFGLDEEQKKLQGKERVEVLQKLADRANDFNVALVEKGAQFDQVAAKFQLPISTTGEFTKTAPDPLLAANPQLAETAFSLRPEEPNSDAIQAGDSFYVMHLAGVEPPRPLTLEEARPKIVDMIKNQRVRELAAARGAEAAQKLREAMKTGAPLDAALAQTGLPTEKIPPFSLAEAAPMPPKPDEPPQPAAADLPTIKSAVGEMNAGEVTDFVPTESGGVIAVVERRDPPDATAYEAVKGMFNLRFLQNKREIAFFEWLRERRREAGVPEAPQLDLPQAG